MAKPLTKLRLSLKSLVSSVIRKNTPRLFELSDKIWHNPEVAYEEYKAHDLLTNFLEKEGFTVERSYTGVETAFRATFGSGNPNVCVICEYDALPGIGHACGHNLIAEAGLAAGLGLKAVLESSDALKGKVTVMGTPAEEGGGGKVKLIDNGAFKDIDLAMMVHPAKSNVLSPGFLACAFMDVTYKGKAAHAAAFPWEGVNALDAAVMAYTSISALRQQMKPDWRVHMIISDGGEKPNIIPEKSSMQIFTRAAQRSDIPVLVEKVQNCLTAAAKASGCTVEITEPAKSYNDLLTNKTLIELYSSNWAKLGVQSDMYGSSSGSTDMGNVSYIVPSIHPKFKVVTGVVPGIHTSSFTAVTNLPDAHSSALVAAEAMVYTCIDILTDRELLAEMKENFKPL